MNALTLDVDILGPPMLAGLLVMSTHAPLGREVLRRGIIFLDLAVAQLAGLGVILAYLQGWTSGSLSTQLFAVTTALLGAAALRIAEHLWPEVLEAIIGTVFVLAATAAIIALNESAHGNEKLRELLDGQILWVDVSRLLPAAVVFAVVLLIWRVFAATRPSWLFYCLFAVCITISVQLVGIYLVFASLIIPALATRDQQAHQDLVAIVIGATGYGFGLVLSAAYDLPSGACIVWSLALTALCYRAACRILDRVL